MAGSRLKPLTVKEIEKLTATRPSTIKHRSLGGVPGFVLVHTPAGHTSFGLIHRAEGARKKFTLGTTKRLSLADARKLAMRFRSEIEAGSDPHGERMQQRLLAKSEQQANDERLDVEKMWGYSLQAIRLLFQIQHNRAICEILARESQNM